MDRVRTADRLRSVAAAAALTSIVMLVGAIALFGGTKQASVADEVVGADVTQDQASTPEPTVQPIAATTSPPTPTAPATPQPTPQPTADTATVVQLATPEPLPTPTPRPAPGLGQWCVGPRAIDVRLAPQDASEVIGAIDADVCDLEQLAEPQEGWLAVRSGSGLDLIEGWVWNSELVPN